MSKFIDPLLGQLVATAPILLVYLVGIVLAILYWRRCPVPSILMLIASLLLLVVTVTQLFVNHYLISTKTSLHWDDALFGGVIFAISLVGSFLRAIALSLLLAAVLIGRRVAQQVGPNPTMGGGT